jgi:hypothetical protein
MLLKLLGLPVMLIHDHILWLWCVIALTVATSEM